MVTWTDNDSRETYIANTGIRAVNKARKLRNTVDNPSWAMSRPESWYLNRNNLSSIKNTLAAIPATTTDSNESRNMYQMLMNQIRGGEGARMTGAPGIVERPMMVDGKPIDRKPINVFGNFGQAGKDFYKKEFPISNFIHAAIPAATNFIPGIGTLKKFLPKRTRELIPRTMVDPLKGIVPYLKPYRFMEDTVKDTVDDGDIWESAAVEEVNFVPTDDNIKEAYEYIFKDNAYSDEFVGNSSIIDTRGPSLEQYLEAMQKPENYEYINSILKQKARSEEMGLI
jgi:hypothetical protein